MLDDETYKNTLQDCVCSALPLCTSYQLRGTRA